MTALIGCTIRAIDMPVTAGAFIALSPDGHINIYVNARSSRAQQREDLKHELDHWLKDDLYNGEDIRVQERDEAGRITSANVFGYVRKAADLLPPPPKPDPAPLRPDVPPLTAWQRRVLHECMASLDAALARATAVPFWPDA